MAETAADAVLVAQVYVDVGLPHLDRPFDYAIPPELADGVKPGVRVKVRFAGRAVDGWVVGVAPAAGLGKLSPLSRLISPEAVAPPTSARLFRAVADHCGGIFCDVARLAVPPRHAATEKAASQPAGPAAPPVLRPSALDAYPAGSGYLEALAAGASPRAAWTVIPTAAPAGDWADGFAAAAAAVLASGRGAVLIAPDAKDCARLMAAVSRRIDPSLIAEQRADLGPAARYRGFLKVLRGQARVVVGTRAAAYAPVADLGLAALWDDGDDSHRDLRSPYPHSRDVLALRAASDQTAVLLGGFSRSAEVQSWLESGWLAPIERPAAGRRLIAPRVLVAGQGTPAGRDPAGTSRLPHDVFAAVRQALTAGPVLVQVAHAGYRRHLRCARCGEPLRCPCGGPLAEAGPARALTCGWCGRAAEDWACPLCGARRWRAGAVGSARTAEELARSFPTAAVIRSDREQPLAIAPDGPALVVATPGAEPPAPGGYAAAVLLDAESTLARADLRAGEEALRRWLQATALVRPAAEGGVAVLVGPPADRAVQAWLRLDPAGHAARELADRRSAGLPPACRFAALRGEAAAIDELVQSWSAAPPAALRPAEAASSSAAGLDAAVVLPVWEES
ncbi:MAG: primosome assembly protein PriA, partial [Propionibacteriaceae bacterium]|nr:primosome assembly protein PriA [Propionibacteriaceae bacterium]